MSPTLILLWDVKRSIKFGRSVNFGVQKFLFRKLSSELHDYFNENSNFRQKARDKEIIFAEMNPKQRYLVTIIESGRSGNPILNELEKLESEILLELDLEIENHISKLPVLLLIPLMGLIFPSMLILIIVPLLKLLEF